MGIEAEGAKALKADKQNPNDWLEPKAVADYLGISLSQVYWYMGQYPPPWPFYRVTATKRLTKKVDLDVWLEKVKASAVTPEQSQGRRN